MTSSDAEAVVGLAITVTLVGSLVGVALYVWYGLALSRLFTKLGADSWRGWVPVLNEMEILSRGGVPAWSVVYYFIPVVNLYGLYLKATAVHRINERLGRGVGFTVLGILLPPVWASLLAWGATPPVAGVGGSRVASMLGNGVAPTASVATGPLGTPTPPPAPFSPVASDPSGYALPVVQPVAAPPAPAFAPPVEAARPAPAAPTAPPRVADEASAPSSTAGLIVNPWAQPAAAAPPAAASTPTISAPTIAAPTSAAPSSAAPSTPTISAPPTIGAPPGFGPAAAESPASEPEPSPTIAPPVTSVFGMPDDDDDEFDRTVVVDRRPVVPWRLRTDDGFEVALTASKIVLGRNPASTELDVEAIAIPDTSRTLSKTHARLDLVDGAWTVTDLHSTNGVLVVDADDSEELIPVDEATPLLSRFVLGKVGMAISHESHS